MRHAPTWECQRSIDVDVPVAFAWAHMTDIRNWNDPPAEFALEGPFVDGARGTTQMPGRSPIRWTIRDITPGRAYTIESDSLLEGGVLLAHWRFEPHSERRRYLHSAWNCAARMPPPHSTRSKRRSRRTSSPACEGSPGRWNGASARPARPVQDVADMMELARYCPRPSDHEHQQDFEHASSCTNEVHHASIIELEHFSFVRSS